LWPKVAGVKLASVAALATVLEHPTAVLIAAAGRTQAGRSSFAARELREIGPADLLDLLVVLNEAGFHAVVHLNRVHALVVKYAGRPVTGGEVLPSDRWYALFDQLDQEVRDAVDGDLDPESTVRYGRRLLAVTAAFMSEEAVLIEESSAARLALRRCEAEVFPALDTAVGTARRTADALLRGSSSHGWRWIANLHSSSSIASDLLDPDSAPHRQRSEADASDGSPVDDLARAPTTDGTDVSDEAVGLPDRPSGSHRGAQPTGRRLREEPPRMESLVDAAIAGDRGAKELLMAEIHPLVLRYCRARLGRQETVMGSADDVAQEVCLSVVNALPGYTLRGLSFRAFIYGIAAHKITDAFRAIGRNRAEPVSDIPDTPLVDGPEHHLLQVELTERLGALLHQLTPTQREVLVLRIAVGLSAEETAQAVGSTARAVRVTQHRALNRLRRKIMTRGIDAEDELDDTE